MSFAVSRSHLTRYRFTRSTSTPSLRYSSPLSGVRHFNLPRAPRLSRSVPPSNQSERRRVGYSFTPHPSSDSIVHTPLYTEAHARARARPPYRYREPRREHSSRRSSTPKRCQARAHSRLTYRQPARVPRPRTLFSGSSAYQGKR